MHLCEPLLICEAASTFTLKSSRCSRRLASTTCAGGMPHRSSACSWRLTSLVTSRLRVCPLSLRFGRLHPGLPAKDSSWWRRRRRGLRCLGSHARPAACLAGRVRHAQGCVERQSQHGDLWPVGSPGDAHIQPGPQPVRRLDRGAHRSKARARSLAGARASCCLDCLVDVMS